MKNQIIGRKIEFLTKKQNGGGSLNIYFLGSKYARSGITLLEILSKIHAAVIPVDRFFAPTKVKQRFTE